MSPILLEVAADDVLQRGGGEEILLAQPQFLAGRRRVGGIEHAWRSSRRARCSASAPTWSPRVEGVEPDRIERRARVHSRSVLTRLPRQPTIGVSKATARDRLGRLPDVARRAVVAWTDLTSPPKPIS